MSNLTYVYDIECYRNYFLVMFVDVNTLQPFYWELHNDIYPWPVVAPSQDTLIAFNSKNYDHPMLSLALQGASNLQLKQCSDEIILGGVKFWQHNFDLYEANRHIDIIEVLPGVANLKIYGGRIGSKKLQDLPIEPDAHISYDDAARLREYCYNDCIVTKELYDKVKPQLDLRAKLGQKYHLDLMSKSDAQIAEAVITSEYRQRTGRDVQKPSSTKLIGTAFRYQPPPFIKFDTPDLQALLELIKQTDFVVGDKGAIKLPPELNNKVVTVADKKYKMGIGGLHSVDKPGSFYADDDTILVDIDVTSYYPAIILNCQYAPSQMADQFLTIYQSIVDQRLEA